jgi:O-antigen ligase
VPVIGANSVGEFAAVLAIVAFARLLFNTGNKSNQASYGLLFAASLLTMILAQTRSALAGFVVGLILVLSLSKRAGLSGILALAATLLLSRAAVSGFLWEFLKRGESEQDIRTLSGRVEWWQFAWQKFLEHPVLGYGAYAAGRSFVMAGFRYDPGSLHSEYAEVLVGTGLLGFVPVVVTLLATWWLLLRFLRNSSLDLSERQLAVEAVGVLGVMSVRSFFSTNLFWHAPVIFFTVLGYAEFLRRKTRCGRQITARPSQVAKVQECIASA